MKTVYQDVWNQEGTRYFLFVLTDPSFMEEFGGEYMVIAGFGNKASVYFLNRGYIHPSYLESKFPVLSQRDSEIISERLNKILEGSS
jgi:hypothetical protein